MSGHTQDPWVVVEHSWSDTGIYAGEKQICLINIYPYATEDNQQELQLEASRHARLIAAAPDHAMIASALCSGVARWESFASGSGGEFCIGGLRHATNLDQFGVPVMTDGMRAALAKVGGAS